MSEKTMIQTTVRLITALCCLVAAPAAMAEEESSDLSMVIRGKGAERIPIAVFPAEAGPGARMADAAEIGEVLAADLDFSGWFGLLDVAGEDRIPADKRRDPKAWAEVGAQLIVLPTYSIERGQARLRVRVIDTAGGEAVVSKTWGGDPARDLRRMAHAASDAIVETLTGTPGIAQTRIAFVSQRGEAKEVFLMDYDGARIRQLTRTETINLAPAWSRDARRLVFLSYLGRKPSIYLLDEKGKVEMLHPAGGDLNAAPDFKPDGRALAFSSDRDGNSEIYLYDLQTGKERRLTHHPAIETAPSWSPSGREIAFTSDRSGSPQIYIMSEDGSGTRRLTYQGTYNESAAWSPTGGRMAFVSRIRGQFEIVIHEFATGAETIITRGRGNKENPRWAPDGRHIVFSGNMSGRYAIYIIRDDGSDLRRLTRGQAAFTPDWSPLRDARR